MLVAERRAAEEQQRVEKEAVERAYTTKLQQYQATLAALEQSSLTSPPTTQPKVSVHHPIITSCINAGGG